MACGPDVPDVVTPGGAGADGGDESGISPKSSDGYVLGLGGHSVENLPLQTRCHGPFELEVLL